LRKAVRSLEVPEDEFFQFTEEIKARWSKSAYFRLPNRKPNQAHQEYLLSRSQ
jgi:hypothetical protein